MRVSMQWYFGCGFSPCLLSLLRFTTRQRLATVYSRCLADVVVLGLCLLFRWLDARQVCCSLLRASWRSCCLGGSVRVRRLARSMLLLIAMKYVRSETYSILIERYTRDPSERE